MVHTQVVAIVSERFGPEMVAFDLDSGLICSVRGLACASQWRGQ